MCCMSATLATILRTERRRAGLSQRALARRAGTTQARISRIERGLESPSFARFEEILLVLGRRPVIASQALDHDVDPGELRHARTLTYSERLAEAASWNLAAGRLAAAGMQARAAGHPATRARSA